MRIRFSRWGRLVAAPLLMAALVSTAQACPMCNQSIAEETHLPRAYMISILFMMSMPAVLFTSFGLFLYFKFRKYNAAQAALVERNGLFASPADAPPSANALPAV